MTHTGFGRHIIFLVFLICLLFVFGGVKAQYVVLPGSATPFRAIPPSDSCSVIISNIDPLFIPECNRVYPQPAFSFRSGEKFIPASFDLYFYILCGILLFVGLVFRSFPKYFHDLFSLFFKAGFRQKSIRDQLAQNSLASLGLNIIFFLTAGLFIYLLVLSGARETGNPWYADISLCIGFLLVVYGVKYLAVSIGGWIFTARELAGHYSFLVFYANKIIGLILLPVVIILWIGNPALKPFFQTTSFLAIGFLFLYRYYLILPLMRSKSGISAFHFFLYLCTFEILPILLLVKFLVDILYSSN
ncbi:MAG: DUF4271 domain-containing protein [Chitinophagaceae bacterium]|nr:DUF4271 domain-containing protein [Chitinophagaceae bacterium]